MNPRQFLLIGGAILLLLGIIGFILPSPVGNTQILHFDIYENWAHTLLGLIAIAFAYAIPMVAQRWVTLAVGVVAVFFAIYGFAVAGQTFPNTFGAANLENPIDNVLHLVVGLWALAVSIRRPETMTAEERQIEQRRRAA